MKILVVEDDIVTLKALEYRLKLEGFEVIVAKDGRHGKKLILTKKPDIIISDILMPHTNGIELLSMVRHEMKLDVPFIIITALGQKSNMDKAIEIGATDYVVKPLDTNELISKIKEYEILKNGSNE